MNVSGRRGDSRLVNRHAMRLLLLLLAGCQPSALPQVDAPPPIADATAPAVDAAFPARDSALPAADAASPAADAATAYDLAPPPTHDALEGDPCDDQHLCATGCCDSTDHCVGGVDDQQCGAGGVRCQPCFSGSNKFGQDNADCRSAPGGGACGCSYVHGGGCYRTNDERCDPQTNRCYVGAWCFSEPGDVLPWSNSCASYIRSVTFSGDECPPPSRWPPQLDTACGVACEDCTKTQMHCVGVAGGWQCA